MKAQPELVAALLQPVLVLLVEQKLHILMTRRTVILTMHQQLKHQQPKHQQLKHQLQKRSSLWVIRCI